ncbi:TetR/AcrR family transcriptional regulator [Sandaracinobacter sp. RS1-74]|uniref:TetR/AcrR family transcriptional regulator n=1 Tax=Sandaracinobacteroides sayramensis TaxID=2913411 RepID=UPI001EDB5FF8|nr:TetR/AcrR family transcriptional regulator [Sandaracinobacteroides sayramensis]MCG2840535.1 TetR/AcrR family transcriptional regulator [Sandaracinobacteroides sayramensis]
MNDAEGSAILAAHPEKPLIYSSSSIQERRRRILRETRKMIAEKGIEGFSIRALCRQADVAQRTLYNAFHDKDRIIALAIREAYEEVNAYMRYRTSADTLEGIVDRLIAVNRRNLKARNYTQAVTSIYFSQNSSRDVWDALRGMAFLNLQQWLNRVAADGDLEEWVILDEVAGDFANLEYAVINDWAKGHISDEDYVRRLITAVLSLAAGVTRGNTQKQARAMLRNIRETGKLPEYPKPVYTPPVSVEEEAAV